MTNIKKTTAKKLANAKLIADTNAKLNSVEGEQVVSTTKLNANEKAVQKEAVKLRKMTAAQARDAKTVIGLLTLAYVKLDKSRAAAKGGTQLNRAEIMGEVNSLADYNPGPANGILKEGQDHRDSRFDSMVRRVVESVIILRAPKSKLPAKLTLSKTGHLQRPHNLTVPTLGKTAKGKLIKNPETDSMDLTVKQVSSVYGDIHPTKKRGTKKDKLQSANVKIADAHELDMDACLAFLSSIVIDQVVNGTKQMGDFFNDKQLAKFDKIIATGNGRKVGTNDRLMLNAKKVGDKLRNANIESAINQATIKKIADNGTAKAAH